MSLITLTPQQFSKTRAARTGGTYKKYLRFLANHRGQQPPQDPYDQIIGQAPQPYSPQQIRQQLAGYTQGMPAPFTPEQIQQQAQGMISPLLAAVTQSINQQASHASDAVRGYTSDLASKLAAMNFAAPYQQGEQAQAHTDAALHQALQGAGASDAQDLASRLAVINDPSVAAAAADVAGNGTANANANLAQGTNAMSDLIAQAAAAGSFGQKLPGIAQLSGLQQLSGIGQNATQQIGQASQQLEGQLPSILQNLTATSNTSASNRAQARQQLIQYLSGVNEGRSKNLLTLKTNKLARQDAFGQAAAKNATAVQVAKTKAAGQATAAEVKQAQSDRTYRLQFSKTYGYDPVTGKTLPGYTRDQSGNVVKTGASKSGVKPPTANEINTWVDGWKNGKPVSVTTIPTNKDGSPKYTDANGNPKSITQTATSGKLSFLQAYKKLRAAGVDDTTARQYLDTAYKRGEQGRGWLTNEEQTTLRTAGLPAAVKLVNGHPVLSPRQVAVLTKAKRLPPGQMTAEGAFVVAQTF